MEWQNNLKIEKYAKRYKYKKEIHRRANQKNGPKHEKCFSP